MDVQRPIQDQLVMRYHQKRLAPFYIFSTHPMAAFPEKALDIWIMQCLQNFKLLPGPLAELSLDQQLQYFYDGKCPDVYLLAPLETKSAKAANSLTRLSQQYIQKDFDEFFHFISLRSVKNRLRLVIIREAHLISERIYNKLLITLEDPPPNLCIMLLNPFKVCLLPTVLSRAVSLRLGLEELNSSYEKLDFTSIEGLHLGLRKKVGLREASQHEGLDLSWSKLLETLKSSQISLEVLVDLKIINPWEKFLPIILLELECLLPQRGHQFKAELLELLKEFQSTEGLGLSLSTRLYPLLTYALKLYKQVEQDLSMS